MTQTLPSIPQEPIHIEALEEEQEREITEMERERIDVFENLDFNFMPLGIEMVGERIQDTPHNESLGED